MRLHNQRIAPRQQGWKVRINKHNQQLSVVNIDSAKLASTECTGGIANMTCYYDITGKHWHQ